VELAEAAVEELIKSTKTEVTTGALITRRIPKSENKSKSFTLTLFTEPKILLVLLSLWRILLFFPFNKYFVSIIFYLEGGERDMLIRELSARRAR